MKYPFYYEVRFRLIAYDLENNIKHESFVRKCENDNPLLAREEAFEIFNEYLSYLINLGRAKSVLGNYKITQPAFVNKILDNSLHNQSSFNDEWFTNYEKFREEISVFLIVTDKEIAENTLGAFSFEDKVEMEFEIHTVASFIPDEQKLVDNLDLRELELYEYFKIDISALKRIVYHYDEDYADSGEDEESGAMRTILETPYVWTTLEEYEFNKNLLHNHEYEKPVTQQFDYEKLIRGGESDQIEFKPTLLFDFHSKQPRYFVKHGIARTICGFLNTIGGILFIGVNDKKETIGIDNDFSIFDGDAKDKIKLEIDGLIASFIGISNKPYINASIEKINGVDIIVIEVQESKNPVFLNKMNRLDGKTEFEKEFYIRMTASTHQLKDVEEIIKYVMNKKWDSLP